jgi:hypothetical protein
MGPAHEDRRDAPRPVSILRVAQSNISARFFSNSIRVVERITGVGWTT